MVVFASLGRSVIIWTPDFLLTLLVLFTMIGINLVGNYVNSIYDFQIDQINKRYRPLPSGKLTLMEVKAISAIFAVTTITLMILSFIGITFYRQSLEHGMVFLLLAVASAILTIEYSAPPLRLKRYLWINNLVQATIRGVIGPLAVWAVYNNINAEIMGLCLTMFVFITFSQSIKDYDDLEGDKKFGIRTLPVVYGIKKTTGLIVSGTAISFFLLGILTYAKILNFWVAVFYVPIAAIFLFYLSKPNQSLLENRQSWVLFYGCMVMLLIGFMIGNDVPL